MNLLRPTPLARLLIGLLVIPTPGSAETPTGEAAPAEHAAVGQPVHPTTAVETPTVEAPAGTIEGIVVEPEPGVIAHAYLGIPYAEPVSGARRWTAPVARARFKVTYRANARSGIIPQNLTDPKLPRDEDGLTINLWTPPGARPGADLPVMVWIHGGGFITGSNADPMYDGARLAAKKNVIVAGINYRLGVLGFLALKEFGLTGNYGFLDQQLALRWVQRNVRAFGGDPRRVTLFGESAGAISIGLHLASAPGSRSLFAGGIMQSNLLAVPLRTLDTAYQYGELFQRILGVKSLEELRRLPIEVLLIADSVMQPVQTKVFHGADTFLLWTPVIDGQHLVRQPMDGFAGGHVEQPFIVGSNAAEGQLFVKGQQIYNFNYVMNLVGLFGDRYGEVFDRYPGSFSGVNNDAMAQMITDYVFTSGTAHALARHAAHPNAAPAWAYHFRHVPSFVVWGGAPRQPVAVHGDEMPFVLNTAAAIDGAFTPEEQALTEAMMTYWTNFARDLDPNGREPGAGAAASVAWPAFSAERAYLLFETSPRVALDPFADTVAYWDRLGYDLRAPEGTFNAVRSMPTAPPAASAATR